MDYSNHHVGPVNDGIPITGTYPYEGELTMGEPQQPPEQQIDGHAYKQWVESYEAKYQPVLNNLQSKITYVSYEVFHEALTRAYQQFDGKVADYIALVEPEKSQKWVTELVMKQGFDAKAYLCVGENGADRLEYSLGQMKGNKDVRDYVIVDDGSYSGNQMANNISSANRIIQKKTEVKQPTFHVIIPYITQTALNKLKELQKDKGIKLEIYHAVIMKTISEEIKSSDLNKIKDVFWKGMDQNAQAQRPNTAALHWFAHKVPNQMSFPDVLAKGTVTHPKSKTSGDPVPFIPEFTPPYKS
ncbi:Uncharacterized protein PRO82_000982 [Candidatus Protochlamydia amoebophila]|uniref:phosphoribosyltransferase-like protein n=1 Tax=Candidatus Protochlamydia amoebophila TaxID=362787 RepID=UPI001BC9357A|nr:hypothetical protein [Candidatus Protochlamydia amoebophila]MBS4163679.1 Uncharacterized protein [Candidatus Protochlamydia amoebophila]